MQNSDHKKTEEGTMPNQRSNGNKRRKLNNKENEHQIINTLYQDDKGVLWIGTYQSLVKKEADYFEQFDVVMIDETHKAKAASIQKITDKCWHCDYRFGLSGTIPKRGTVDRLTLMSAMGPLVTQVRAAQLQEEGHISNCKVIQLQMEYATDEQKDAFWQFVG